MKSDRALLVGIFAALLFLVGATIRSCSETGRYGGPIPSANHWGYR